MSYEVDQYASAAAEDNVVVKATKGVLYGISVKSTTAQFIQLHNAAAVPSNNAVPYDAWPIEANGTLTVNYDPPLVLSTGIVIANSSTFLTLTDAGDDCLILAQYK